MHFPFRPEGSLFGTMSPGVLIAVCLIGGIVFLLLGWNFYRFTLLLLGAVVGGGLGWGIGSAAGIEPVLTGVLGGVLVAVLIFLVEKAGFFIAGGTCAALPIFIFLTGGGHGNALFLFAGLAFVIAGALTLLIRKPIIVVSMSVIGSVALANGLLLIMESYHPEFVEGMMSEYSGMLVIGIIGMALGGIMFQSRGDYEEDKE